MIESLKGRNPETVRMREREEARKKFWTFVINLGIVILLLLVVVGGPIGAYKYFSSDDDKTVVTTTLVAKDSQVVAPKKQEDKKPKADSKPKAMNLAAASLPKKAETSKVSKKDSVIVVAKKKNFWTREITWGRVKRFWKRHVYTTPVDTTLAPNGKYVTQITPLEKDTAGVSKAIANTMEQTRRMADSAAKVAKERAKAPPLPAPKPLEIPYLSELPKFYPSVFKQSTNREKCFGMLPHVEKSLSRLASLRSNKKTPALDLEIEENISREMRIMMNSPACRTHLEPLLDGKSIEKDQYMLIRSY